MSCPLPCPWHLAGNMGEADAKNEQTCVMAMEAHGIHTRETADD